MFSFWKTKIPEPSQKKKLFVDDSVLINLFERLAEEKEELKVNFRFVLSLILMRKRRLKYEDSRRDGTREIWSMRFVRETETHDVFNPQLTEEQIQEVFYYPREVIQILGTIQKKWEPLDSLQVANGLFVQKNFTLLPTFQEPLERELNAFLKELLPEKKSK